MRKICFVFVALFAIACSSGNQSPWSKIILEKSIEESPKPLSLNDIADVVSIFEVNSCDSVLLSNITVKGIQGDTLLLNTNRGLYAVSAKSGQILHEIGHIGRGYGEYLMCNNVTLDRHFRTLYLSDGMTKRILKYGYDGEFICTEPVEDAYSVYEFSNGYKAVTNAEYGTRASLFDIYDNNWVLKRTGSIKSVYPKPRMTYLNAFSKDETECLFKKMLGDTIYVVTPESEEPYCVIDKGRYKAPYEFMCDLDLMYDNGDKYIMNEGVFYNSSHVCIDFALDKKWYFTLWDIASGELLGSYIRTSLEDPYGFQVTVNDKTANVEPIAFTHDYMFCRVLDDSVDTLFPNISEIANPVLLMMKLKK